jgi:hypothetical protein
MGGNRRCMRNLLVDGPASAGQRLRARRWDWFSREFPGIAAMSVIDLGGTAEAWLRAPIRPASVHVVNLRPEPAASTAEWIRADQGDACDLPDHIRNGRYDLVFSNSVLEHVGGHAQRMRFAEAAHKLGDLHWIQTPYRYFPIEPHLLFPGFQFLPLTVRAELSRRWPLTHTKPGSWHEGLEAVIGVELVSRAEMSYYFPSSVIGAERVLGLPKSLVAIKSA